MMDLDTSHIADPKIKEFIEIAYLRRTLRPTAKGGGHLGIGHEEDKRR